jgi:hypothetical protein
MVHVDGVIYYNDLSRAGLERANELCPTDVEFELGFHPTSAPGLELPIYQVFRQVLL